MAAGHVHVATKSGVFMAIKLLLCMSLPSIQAGAQVPRIDKASTASIVANSTPTNTSDLSAGQWHLSARAPPVLTYPDAVAKGKTLIEAMDAAPHLSDDFQSKWTDFKDLAKPESGWIKEADMDFEIPEPFGNGMGTAAQMIGISRGAHGNTVPELSQWSDVTFLQWQELTKDNDMLDKLQYVAHHVITNKPTEHIMNHVTNGKLDEATVPGYSFNLGTDAFAALLGTPLGAGPAYLLAQHKKQLGWKTIQSIRIFTVGTRPSCQYQMIFKIVPHPKASLQRQNQRRSPRSATVSTQEEC
ncbi:hypothetical protein M409DRAFT_19282 [Zasmidium cellare ATCC 36951]|uniref:Uncharacterized protein n=1 Tax=Zasmidium cellare ATCC 36951 TaxID=1080233 RepID=A0A6A6CTP0_ZASCE|nr:uncharacterized protein M409DRAFT_19282 [Zasmidium cellare ATCC 36951]KAF2170461.1 hypothetical protein M409DRAFT_19282 [Zasmidium cellare ATCC 36951]